MNGAEREAWMGNRTQSGQLLVTGTVAFMYKEGTTKYVRCCERPDAN